MIFELASFLVDTSEASERRYRCNVGLGSKDELVYGFSRLSATLGGNVIEVGGMTDGVFPVSTGHVGMEQQAFSSLPNSHNRIFGDANGIVLIFGCHFVVDKVFLQESGHAVRDNFSALVGSENFGEVSDLGDESTEGIEV